MNQTRLSPSISLVSLSLLSSIVVCGSRERRSHFTPVDLSRRRRHRRRAPIAHRLGSSTSYLPLCRSNSVLAPSARRSWSSHCTGSLRLFNAILPFRLATFLIFPFLRSFDHFTFPHLLVRSDSRIAGYVGFAIVQLIGPPLIR